MEKRSTLIVAACGIILAAFLALVTVKILQDRGTPPPGEKTAAEAEAEKPAPERRHGPRVRRKVDIGSTFSGMAPVRQDGAANDEGEHKELHMQTPDEAVESAWQALDTYREQTPEEKAQTQFALGIVNAIINAISANAGQFTNGMDARQRAETVEHAMTSLENINAIEQQVGPDMTPEERQVLGGTIQAIRNLNMSLLNSLR